MRKKGDSKCHSAAMFYFRALNSGQVISGNDISIYPVTGIGFVFRV